MTVKKAIKAKKGESYQKKKIKKPVANSKSEKKIENYKEKDRKFQWKKKQSV